MNEYDERVVIMRRQIEGLQGAVSFYQQKQNESDLTLQRLQSTVAELSTQLQSISQTIAVLRVKAMGHGSTV